MPKGPIVAARARIQARSTSSTVATLSATSVSPLPNTGPSMAFRT